MSTLLLDSLTGMETINFGLYKIEFNCNDSHATLLGKKRKMFLTFWDLVEQQPLFKNMYLMCDINESQIQTDTLQFASANVIFISWSRFR